MRIVSKLVVQFFTLMLLVSLATPVVRAKQSRVTLKEFTFGKKDQIRVGYNKQTITVQIKPREGDGLYRFASWTMKDWRNNYQKIKQFNHNKPLLKGQYVTFPFKYLKDSIQGIALQAVFNKDSAEEKGWAHRVTYPGESMSLISGLYAKEEFTAKDLLKYNGLSPSKHVLKMDQVIIIPWEWLRSELNLFPYQVKPPLEIKQDGSGKRFASYKLQQGESIYSAVVVRFTGRILADEVNEMANKLLILNKIKDEHRIYVGTELLIPLEWISEEYLAQDTPKLSDDIEEEKKIAQKPPTAIVGFPIHVILDAGHGGRDPGATLGSLKNRDLIYEDELVYDINLRLTDILKTRNIVVHNTLRDPNQLEPVETLSFKKDEDEVILVNPNYNIQKVRTGVNMRVYLINHIYNRLRKEKVPKENIIMISLHGDALHKSMYGTMVYFPDPRLRNVEFKLRHSIYKKRKEYQKRIGFTDSETRSAARMSSAFGNAIVETLGRNGLDIQKNHPVRGYHYRKGTKTLPAVLRYCKVPTSVLVEVGNLANTNDRHKMLKAGHRQKLAEGLADSISAHLAKNGKV